MATDRVRTQARLAIIRLQVWPSKQMAKSFAFYNMFAMLSRIFVKDGL